jgi:hypothetical protein
MASPPGLSGDQFQAFQATMPRDHRPGASSCLWFLVPPGRVRRPGAASSYSARTRPPRSAGAARLVTLAVTQQICRAVEAVAEFHGGRHRDGARVHGRGRQAGWCERDHSVDPEQADPEDPSQEVRLD